MVMVMMMIMHASSLLPHKYIYTFPQQCYMIVQTHAWAKKNPEWSMEHVYISSYQKKIVTVKCRKYVHINIVAQPIGFVICVWPLPYFLCIGLLVRFLVHADAKYECTFYLVIL